MGGANPWHQVLDIKPNKVSVEVAFSLSAGKTTNNGAWRSSELASP